MDYAQIKDGVVVNIIDMRQELEEEFLDCVPMGNIPAGIGDTYEDGKFYRDGVEIKSTAQQLAEANDIINILLGGETA